MKAQHEFSYPQIACSDTASCHAKEGERSDDGTHIPVEVGLGLSDSTVEQIERRWKMLGTIQQALI
jgi:hypothetical protein